ncbi:receptor-type tyrosine-protein phosphatase H isoform X2 [Pangasianodon hypophthalmus]|uniref:receptor-type tyrosine-protein phosphatase H isoform X2 n=1 Tax=Pangasianodon hypophthalmus TaxID=310915 RepID=UPI000EFF3724|nr:receptor-type tyrosine-protein phosphatase H isoform X2 [Pangasianodon hypophthalmus]
MRIISLLLMCWSVAPMWRLSSLASPPNVMGVFVKARTETLLTLEWTKMNNFSYILRYSNGTETPLTVSADGSVLRYTVSSLSPGTKYTFVLYAVFKGVKHSAFNFTAVTSPSNVASVSVKARSETALTFEWSKVKNNSVYTYILRQSNRSDVHTPMYWGGSTATHTVSSLSPGTKYAFTLYTVFGGERSSGYNFSAATMPLNVASVNVTQRFANRLELSWEEVKSNNISYILRHGSKAETTIAALEKSSVMTHTVSSLSPGTRYNFTLYTVFEGVRSRGLTFSSVTASLTVTGLRCEHLSGGNALALVWDAPSGQWTGVEVQMKGRNPQYSNGTRLEFHDLHPALWYDVTLKLCSGDVKSAPVSISCQTDPRDKYADPLSTIIEAPARIAALSIGSDSRSHIGSSIHGLPNLSWICISQAVCPQQKNSIRLARQSNIKSRSRGRCM